LLKFRKGEGGLRDVLAIRGGREKGREYGYKSQAFTNTNLKKSKTMSDNVNEERTKYSTPT